MTKTKSSSSSSENADSETKRWASDLPKQGLKPVEFPLSEVFASQPRQRSLSLTKPLISVSPRKKSVEILAPIPGNLKSKSQPRMGPKNKKLISSKSSPNFQELLKQPNFHANLERLVSVDDQEINDLGPDLPTAPLRRVHSNHDITSQYLRTTRYDYDHDTPFMNPGHITNSPRPLSSRSNLLEPISNPPKISKNDDLQSARFSISPAPSRRNISPIGGRRGTPVDVRKRERRSEPMIGGSKLENISHPRHLSDEVFEGRPRADPMLNLRYTPEGSPPETYRFSSKPKTVLTPINQRKRLNDIESMVADVKPLSEFENFSQFDRFSDFNMGNEWENDQNILENSPKTSQSKFSPSQSSYLRIPSPQLNTGNDLPTQFSMSANNAGVKMKRPFVTIEELEEMSTSSTMQTNEETDCGVKDGPLTRQIDDNTERDVGIYTTVATREHSERNTSSMAEVNDQLGPNKTDMSSITTQNVDMSANTSERDCKPVQTPLKKAALSARAAGATYRLYDVRKAQVKTPSTPVTRNQKLGKVKSRSQILNENAKVTPQQQRPARPKKVANMGSKPSTAKGKKTSKNETFEKTKNDKKKPEVASKSAKNGYFSRIKKASEYEAKTEKMLQHMQEQLSGGKSNVSSSSRVNTASAINNVPSTPVIEEAYPKFDDGEKRLLDKVRVTVPDVRYPRRIHSSASRKPKNQTPNKKSKETKNSVGILSPDAEELLDTNAKNTKGKKTPRAKSAGLIAEKRKKSGNSFVSLGEEISEIEPDQIIFSGKNWSVVTQKLQSHENVAESYLKNDILPDLDAIKISDKEPVEHGDKNTELEMRLTDFKIHNVEKIEVQGEGIGAGLVQNITSELQLNEENEHGETEGPLNFICTVDSGANAKPGTINSKSAFQQNLDGKNDLPSDVEIEVIPLPENEAKNTQNSSVHLKLKNEKSIRNLPQFFDQNSSPNHSFTTKTGEVVVTQEDLNFEDVVFVEGEDAVVEPPKEVWSNHNSDDGTLTITEHDSDEESTIDIEYNLQNLMKSMRQRSELDAHTLANYRKKREEEGSDTDSDDTYKADEVTQSDLTEFEDNFLGMLFDNGENSLQGTPRFSNLEHHTALPKETHMNKNHQSNQVGSENPLRETPSVSNLENQKSSSKELYSNTNQNSKESVLANFNTGTSPHSQGIQGGFSHSLKKKGHKIFAIPQCESPADFHNKNASKVGFDRGDIDLSSNGQFAVGGGIIGHTESQNVDHSGNAGEMLDGLEFGFIGGEFHTPRNTDQDGDAGDLLDEVEFLGGEFHTPRASNGFENAEFNISSTFAETGDQGLNNSIPFLHYQDNVDEPLDDNSGTFHPDTDEEEMEGLMKTIIAEDSDENLRLDAGGDVSMGKGDKLVDFMRLTMESLHLHNQQHRNILPKEGSVLSMYGKHMYNPLERENMQSQMSSATGTTDTQDTNSTLKGELNTAACQGWRRGVELGRGSYGIVYEGLIRYGQLIAVKVVELNTADRGTAEKQFKQVQAEVALLKTLKHENVVRLLGTDLIHNTVEIFMEHVAGGSIASLLQRLQGPLDERVFRNYTKQILTGVEYLHRCKVVHRDIKGSNIMLMPACGTIKLIDFGCAKRLKETAMCNDSHGSEDGKLSHSMKGTPYWMAPEVIISQGHGPKSDIWSIGCTVYEMATTKPPLHDLEPFAAIYRIGNGNVMPVLPRSTFSRSTVNFVKKCLIRDPRIRPSASELLQHKFIARHRPRSSTNRSNDQGKT